MEKGTVFGILVWVVIIGLFILVPKACNRVSQNKTASTEHAAQDEFNQWCAANNATPGFKGLPESNLLKIDLQQSLFVNEKRVAFRAPLTDMARTKDGEISAVFTASYSDTEIGVYLKCTEVQAQELRDDYHRDKDSTFLIVAEFEEIKAQPKTNSDSDSDYQNAYHAIGTLVASKIAKQVPSDNASTVQDTDHPDY